MHCIVGFEQENILKYCVLFSQNMFGKEFGEKYKLEVK